MLYDIKKIILMMFFLTAFIQPVQSQDPYVTKEIKYKTEDGWTISGTLRLPAGANSRNEYAAVILLHEKEHDRSEFVGIGAPGLARKLPEFGIATLNIDLRGRGLSMGDEQPVSVERHDFSTMINENTYQDIKAGMDFLYDYPGVDGLRIGIVAMEYSGEHAIRAIRQSRVPTRALVIIGGTNISEESKEYLTTVDFPILTGAYVANRQIFNEMAGIYAHSKNPYSWVFTPHPGESDYDASARILNESSWRTEYTIIEIHGNFRYPDELGKDAKKIPGVVIAPGGRSNRDSYFRFEEELARRGIAVVSVEQRGRGQSTMGRSFDDPEIAKLWEEDPEDSPYYLDVIAGLDYLVSQEGIDPDNIGLLGGARGSRNAILAAGLEPDRIKAMVLMSVYYSEDIEAVLPGLDASTLLIAAEHRNSDNTRRVHNLMKNSDLQIVSGDAQTHHIRDIQPGIVKDVGDFMERVLNPSASVE
jgi:dienelactone hydrolase